MNKRNRDRLLRLAKFLDGRARSIRRYVEAKTPKRGPRKRTDG